MIAYPINIPLHIQRRGLPRVESIDRKSPVGLFSPSIFGLTQEERRTKGAYISLNCYVVRPNVLLVLKRISRLLYRVATEKTPFIFNKKDKMVYEKAKYLEENGELPEDYKEGYSSMFLYEIWDELDTSKFHMDQGSHINKEMKLSLSKKNKEDIFTAHQYVMALAYREEPEEDSTILQNEVNQLYVNILKYANILENNTLSVDTSDIYILIQKAVLEAYENQADRYIGPKGAFRKNLMSRVVANSCRLTIVPANYKSTVLGHNKYGITSAGIPLHHILNMFRDFFIKFSKDFITYMFEHNIFDEDVTSDMLDVYDSEYLEHLISNMEVQHTRVQPFQLIKSDGTFKDCIIPFEVDKKENGTYVLETKPLSNMEFFYIIAVQFIHIHETKAVVMTRYPTDSTLSSQVLFPNPTTLFNRYLKPTKVLDMEFDEYYPYVDDYIVKNYHRNLFEQGCRLTQATTVGYNGKVIAPIHSNMCLKLC